ncbi:hypothetical protein GOP47_0017504 [Adiantum capillus-veneris]|uniref:Uncharacterized protein n=1 Tax=Adiantum capillus-veneris TaxID=13818 RepID=A0A9D4UGP4_ADICA|nr:hypothetical protein GOP47_0017504 [Adiantum capillus-veneris]
MEGHVIKGSRAAGWRTVSESLGVPKSEDRDLQAEGGASRAYVRPPVAGKRGHQIRVGRKLFGKDDLRRRQKCDIAARYQGLGLVMKEAKEKGELDVTRRSNQCSLRAHGGMQKGPLGG